VLNSVHFGRGTDIGSAGPDFRTFFLPAAVDFTDALINLKLVILYVSINPNLR